jgi:hypothetical protein
MSLILSRGDTIDLVDAGCTGFAVDVEDSGAVADRMEWLLRFPDEARAMGVRAREQLCFPSGHVRGVGRSDIRILLAAHEQTVSHERSVHKMFVSLPYPLGPNWEPGRPDA